MTKKLMLKTAKYNTLHGYIFTDQDHARKWLAQPIIQEDIGEYKICIVTLKQRARRCHSCGAHDRQVLIERTMKAADFLALGPLELGEPAPAQSPSAAPEPS